MPAGGVTKAELLRTNGALEALLKSGHFTLIGEQEELDRRAFDVKTKQRSRAASQRTRDS